MKNVIFSLEPLSCPTCIKRIEGSLNKMKGVKEAKVSFHSNKIRVQFDDDVVEVSQLQVVIVKLGYPVLSQKISHRQS